MKQAASYFLVTIISLSDFANVRLPEGLPVYQFRTDQWPVDEKIIFQQRKSLRWF